MKMFFKLSQRKESLCFRAHGLLARKVNLCADPEPHGSEEEGWEREGGEWREQGR